MLIQWGRRGLRTAFAGRGWFVCVVVLLGSGCSRKSAHVSPIQSPQQLEEKLTRAIGDSDAVADGDKPKGDLAPPVPPAPAPAPKKEEADANQRLKLTLESNLVAKNGKLSGTVSGGFGDDVVRVLWVDGAGRVVSVAEVKPSKERENAASFELPIPPETYGTQHRAVLVAATKDAVKKAAKEGGDPFRVQSKIAFSVAAEQAGFGDYRVLSAETLAPVLPEDQHPLLSPAAFADDLPDESNLCIEKALPASPGEKLRSLLNVKNASAGELGSTERRKGWHDVFHGWLEDRYGKLATLNAHWGTSFKSWNEVASATSDEAKAANNQSYARKLQEGEEPAAEKKPEKKAEEKKAPESKEAKTAEKPAKDAKKEEKAENGEQDAEFTLAPEELRASGGENFASWCDARSFDDFAFSRLLREYRSQLRAHQPDALCGIIGAEAPAAFGGWDWFQVTRSLDWLKTTNSPAYTRTLARSFNPRLMTMSTMSAGHKADVYALWDRWLRGDDGVVLSGEHWIEKNGSPSADAKAISADVKELAGGLTLLRNAAKLREDSVAIWYSPKSIQLHWMIDSEGDGSHWRNRNGETELRQGSAHLQYQAWTMLLEDLGYTPRFIHPQQAFDGELDARKIRVLILPKVLSLSDAEARAIRDYASSGGLVIADGACGTFDGVGRRRMVLREDHPAGALDADFGIARDDLIVQERNGVFTGDAEASRILLRDRVSGQPFGPESNELKVLEPGLKVSGGQSHARAKGVEDKRGAPALVMREAGLGRFIYLNLSLQDYPVLRALPSDDSFRYHGMTQQEYTAKYGRPRGGEALRLIVSDMLAEALGENPLKLRTEDGLPVRGVRRTAFDLGAGVQLYGLLPEAAIAAKPQGEAGVDVSGLAFNTPLNAWIGTGKPQHWYDLRTGAYLGHEAMVKATIDPYRTTLLSALPYEVEKLSVKCRRLDERGAFKMSLNVQCHGGDAISHIVHVDVFAPNGELLPHSSRNIVAPKGQWTGTILLGLNEPPGKYRVSVKDVLSGRITEAELIKEASEYEKCCPVPEHKEATRR